MSSSLHFSPAGNKSRGELLVAFVSQSKQVCFLQSVNTGDTWQKQLYLRYDAGGHLPCCPKLVANLLLFPNLGVHLERLYKLCDRELTSWNSWAPVSSLQLVSLMLSFC